MSCVHPFKAFPTGYLTANGKRDFNLFYSGSLDEVDLARCKKPVDLSKVSYHFRNGHIFLDDPIDIPCGKCVGCRMQDSLEWKIRCCLELQDNPECYFLTLTYDDDHLPFNEFGEPIVSFEDIQKFMKRLRFHLGDFRYFGCLEYGDTTSRPHAHMLLYGHLEGFKLYSPGKFVCPVLDDIWKMGQVIIEEVSPGNIAYVCGYVEKKQIEEVYGSFPENGKPRRFMSRKPGIGMAYIDRNIEKIKSTMKVYGRFADDIKNSSAIVPHALRRRFDGEPWYEQYKQAAILAGESMRLMDQVVYRCKYGDRLTDLMEDSCIKKVTKLRKGSL